MPRSPLVSKGRWLQFLAALGASRLTPAVVIGILRELPGILRRQPQGQIRKRWKACGRCVLYNPVMRTCHGCGCYMPFKALSSSASCWLNEHRPELNLGWKQLTYPEDKCAE